MATREEQIKYQVAWMKRRRDAWFAVNGPCVDCGSWDALELDHVDAALKVNHRVWSWSEARREAELAKCVARCKACHRVKTYANGEHLNRAVLKLTVERVLAIRSRAAEGELHRVLADEFGVSRRMVSLIVRRERWSHV